MFDNDTLPPVAAICAHVLAPSELQWIYVLSPPINPACPSTSRSLPACALFTWVKIYAEFPSHGPVLRIQNAAQCQGHQSVIVAQLLLEAGQVLGVRVVRRRNIVSCCRRKCVDGSESRITKSPNGGVA